MNRYSLLSIACLCVAAPMMSVQLMAQQPHVTVIYKHRNLPQAGDSLIKQQVAYIDPGAAGKEIHLGLPRGAARERPI